MKLAPNWLVVLLLAALCLTAKAQFQKGSLAHTFSIVARDRTTGEMAVGVQSHWFSVGTVVAWGKSGVGVVATQSFVEPAYGPRGIALMEQGIDAQNALHQLVEADEGRAYRQVAFLDLHGVTSAYTGASCIQFASDHTGVDYSVQANMMLNDAVVPAMARTFEEHTNLPLAERVLRVLQAAQAAGGDIRGRQSAALIVVGPEKVDPWRDKLIDLRVDDSADPLVELGRLLKIQRAYEHMNKGDLAVEKNDMVAALKEYGAAEAMFPANLEMKYWKAVALANNGRLAESLTIFKEVFEADPNWKELTRRLPASNLLTLSEADLRKVLGL